MQVAGVAEGTRKEYLLSRKESMANASYSEFMWAYSIVASRSFFDSSLKQLGAPEEKEKGRKQGTPQATPQATPQEQEQGTPQGMPQGEGQEQEQGKGPEQARSLMQGESRETTASLTATAGAGADGTEVVGGVSATSGGADSDSTASSSNASNSDASGSDASSSDSSNSENSNSDKSSSDATSSDASSGAKDENGADSAASEGATKAMLDSWAAGRSLFAQPVSMTPYVDLMNHEFFSNARVQVWNPDATYCMQWCAAFSIALYYLVQCLRSRSLWLPMWTS